MRPEARIRLEGRLETVERAVHALTAATHAPADYNRLALAIDQMTSADTREAEQQVMKLAKDDAALRPLLEASQKAKQRAGHAVFARARLLGMPERSLLDTACAVANERVRFDTVIRNPWTVPVLCTMAIMWTVLIAVSRQPVFALQLVIVSAVMLVGHFCYSVRAVVTEGRVVLGEHIVHLDQLTGIEFERLWRRSFRPYLALIRLRDGRVLEQRLPWVPDGLVRALHAEGVSTRQHFWPWS